MHCDASRAYDDGYAPNDLGGETDAQGDGMAEMTEATSAAPPVEYGWLPPAQQVGGGAVADLTVPAGYIHQTAWAEGGGPDVRGVYAHPNSGWESMIWRWADTMRSNSIQHVTR